MQSGKDVVLEDRVKDMEMMDEVAHDTKIVYDVKMAGEDASGDGGMEKSDE